MTLGVRGRRATWQRRWTHHRPWIERKYVTRSGAGLIGYRESRRSGVLPDEGRPGSHVDTADLVVRHKDCQPSNLRAVKRQI
jgi:hypothetical protein